MSRPTRAYWCTRYGSAIAAKIERLYGHRYDPDDEITVTAGATQAILTATLALIHAGDEAIVLHPSYAMYRFYAEVAGAEIREIPYRAETLAFPMEELLAAITPATLGSRCRKRSIYTSPPRSLKAPTGVWFSCLIQTSTLVRAERSGQ